MDNLHLHKANVVSIFCTVPPNIISVFRFYFIVASCDVFCIKVLIHISNLNTVKSDYLSDVRSFFLSYIDPNVDSIKNTKQMANSWMALIASIN